MRKGMDHTAVANIALKNSIDSMPFTFNLSPSKIK